MYTHDFQIEVGDISANGEISFNGGEAPKIDLDVHFCAPVEQTSKIKGLLDKILDIYNNCGDINKFKVIKK